MYANLCNGNDLDAKYEDGVTFVRMNKLHPFAVPSINDVKESDGRSH